MNELTWPLSSFLLNGVLTAGDRMYSPGPPSWSPDGQWLSYVWAGNGKNQLWLQANSDSSAAPVSKHTVLVEPTDGTDRRDVGGGPQWSPDARQVAVVGPSPPTGGRTSIFILDILSGERRQLTDHPANDRTPRWSPDGASIAFVAAWDAGGVQIEVVAAGGGVPIQLTVDRHSNTDLAWSPDSRSIAFSSQRSDSHLFAAGIGVVEIATGAVDLIEHPSAANERMPRFSPDASQLAFVSDRDGFDSLWIYSLRGSSLQKIDVGPGEVSHPAWASDGRRIAFSLTSGVLSRVGCVDLVTNSVTWCSPESGVALWPTWSPNDGRLAYAWTDAVTPGEIWKADPTTGASRPVTSTAPDKLPRHEFVRPERVSYRGANGLEIDALLYRSPAKSASGGGILWVHGGPNWLVRDMFDPFLQYLVAAEGYTILAPNVRGSTGYGRDYMELNTGDYGGADQQDWLAAVNALVDIGKADRSRIAIWGRSYGGFATMLSLGQHPEIFCCGVAQFGVSDWQELWDQSIPWVRRLLAHQLGHPTRDRALYVERSPLSYVDQLKSPILMLHGGADIGVPPDQSRTFAKRLAGNLHISELVVYPDEGHGFNQPHHIVDAAGRITAFFRRHLAKDSNN